MYDVFNKVRLNITKDNRIPTKTLLTLNPSSQVCYDENDKQLGTCLRQVWLQKTDQVKSNPINSQPNLSSSAGNWYESWFIDQLKETGIHHDSGFPATDVERFVKGIVDVSIKIPEDGSIELGEIKTYDGSNYANSQVILGTAKIPPKPRDKHLLQAFRYSLIFKDYVNNLFYIDRACGAWYKNKQFKIELLDLGGAKYPKLSTVWKDEYYEYTDTRISDVGVYRAEEKLLGHFFNGTVPDKEFIETFDPETVALKRTLNEIPDYLYVKYQKDPVNNPLGDFNCKYCPFAKGTCADYE